MEKLVRSYKHLSLGRIVSWPCLGRFKTGTDTRVTVHWVSHKQHQVVRVQTVTKHRYFLCFSSCRGIFLSQNILAVSVWCSKYTVTWIFSSEYSLKAFIYLEKICIRVFWSLRIGLRNFWFASTAWSFGVGKRGTVEEGAGRNGKRAFFVLFHLRCNRVWEGFLNPLC